MAPPPRHPKANWRARALHIDPPEGLAISLMTLGPSLDAALNVPDPAAREAFLREVLTDLEDIAHHVRVAARRAQAAQVSA